MDRRKGENPSNRRRPSVHLEDCISIDNDGDGFRIEGVDVTGKNLLALRNGGEGIRVIGSKGDFEDPNVEN